MKKIIYLAAVMAIFSMLLPACTSVPQQLHSIKGTFTEAQLGGDAQTLNWIIATDGGASKRYASFMIDPLAVFDNQFKLQLRCLAKDIEVSSDGLTYTVTIRDDLKWSDGSKVKADDYVYTINNIMLADWLNCTDITGLPATSFCMACYDGKYPVPYDPVLDKHIIERRKRQAQTLGESVTKDSEQIKLLQV